MDPKEELLKHLPEFLTVAKVAAGSIPFTAVVKRMLGPAADEVADMWKDKVRLYRYGNQLKCIQKAEKMAEAAAFKPKAVPIKILFPLLEGASMEEDENLQDMWAALLANASAPKGKRVSPRFIAILRELSPEEALILNLFFDERVPWNEVAKIFFTSIGQRPDRFEILGECLDGLESAGIIRLSKLAQDLMKPFTDPSNFPSNFWRLDNLDRKLTEARSVDDRRMRQMITYRGVAFVEACRPPKPSK